MASNAEIASSINAVGADVADARMQLTTAQETIHRAQRALFEAMGETTPGHLIDYQGALNNAVAKIDQAVRFLDGGLESGQSYIGQLYS
jgi:hypothetical protein